jgi:hypothetical protein
VEIRRNIRNAWWRSMVQLRDEIVGPGGGDHHVAEGVGGVAATSRASTIRSSNARAAIGGSGGPPGSAAGLPALRRTRSSASPAVQHDVQDAHGPVEDESGVTYLRPETAQGMFVDFPLVQTVARKKLPFGIAQIGKSFRNEITPANFIFRTREFEQMEMEYFVSPGPTTSGSLLGQRAVPVVPGLGVSKDKLRCRRTSRRAGALREVRDRHRVRVPVRLVGARGHREPDGLRPEAHQEASGRT